ncbi:MAG: hypothetical protein L3J49_06990 [Desulfobulbaceae bacterium]|nr:hypothetical protein [Desulfobulbaceae bacterium]
MILAAATQATPYSGLPNSDISADLQSEATQPVTGTTPPTGSVSSNPQDTITLSQDGLNRSRQGREATNETSESRTPGQTGNSSSGSPAQLTPEEQQAVLQLKQRDIEVKAHEAAHLANAGQYAAGGPSYTYQTGPDGRRYAIGGEVPIDVGKEKTPEQTLQKMRIVRRAAMAPANPSSADRSIAAAAGMAEAEALREINSPKIDSSDQESTQNISSTPEQSQDENSAQQPLNRREFQGIYA